MGNADGVFDAAYDFGGNFGEVAQRAGTPEQIGAEIVRCLSSLTADACREIQYGTPRFFVELVVMPLPSASDGGSPYKVSSQQPGTQPAHRSFGGGGPTSKSFIRICRPMATSESTHQYRSIKLTGTQRRRAQVPTMTNSQRPS